MFSTPRLFIKTGIAFLGIGLLIGGWLLVNRELRGRDPTRSWPLRTSTRSAWGS